MQQRILSEFDTAINHYQIVEMVYDGRPARVLFSGHQQAAQSGVALDGAPDLLFDYNQRFREIAASVQPRRALLIGGGACTLPTALLREHPDLEMTVIEPDGELVEHCRKYFDIPIGERLHIYNNDGREWLDADTSSYDLLLVDAFSHVEVPRSLITLEAVNRYAHVLRPNGLSAVNVISALYGRHAAILERQVAAHKTVFSEVAIYPASRSLLSFYIPQNFILVSGKVIRPLDLRHEPVNLTGKAGVVLYD